MGLAVPDAVYLTFTKIHCYKCSVPFWVPDIFNAERHRLGDEFYCPAGHSQVYKKSDAEKEAERLRGLLNDATRRNTDLTTNLTTTQVERDKLARKLKRVQRGVCPQCNRSFQNLARHMCTKHGEQK